MNAIPETGLEFAEWIDEMTANLESDPEFERMAARLNLDPEDLGDNYAE